MSFKKLDYKSRFSPDSLFSGDSLEDTSKHYQLMSQFSDDSLEDTLRENPAMTDNNYDCGRRDDDDPMEYLDREVFPVLLPCFEEMLFAAKQNHVLKVQKSRFNGLDYLAELLWNRNPLHPERDHGHVPIFDIPFVKDWLVDNPRRIFPKSWLWSPSEAAVVIQSAVRGYFVRRLPQVQELRLFWKTLAEERCYKDEEKQLKKYSVIESSTI